jgi:hypothetical protein
LVDVIVANENLQATILPLKRPSPGRATPMMKGKRKDERADRRPLAARGVSRSRRSCPWFRAASSQKLCRRAPSQGRDRRRRSPPQAAHCLSTPLAPRPEQQLPDARTPARPARFGRATRINPRLSFLLYLKDVQRCWVRGALARRLAAPHVRRLPVQLQSRFSAALFLPRPLARDSSPTTLPLRLNVS